MAVCSVCANELRPEWKFCVYCGMRVAPLFAEQVQVDVAEPVVDRSDHVNPVAVVAIVFGVVAVVSGVIAGRRAVS